MVLFHARNAQNFQKIPTTTKRQLHAVFIWHINIRISNREVLERVPLCLERTVIAMATVPNRALARRAFEVVLSHQQSRTTRSLRHRFSSRQLFPGTRRPVEPF
jgi:hypothetical protein